MEESHQKIPEWGIFKRLEHVELTQKDIAIIAVYGFQLAFAAFCQHAPKNARKIKDIILGDLKRGLSKIPLDVLTEGLTDLCDFYDK